ncbi:hypothetical protein GCM10022225_82230 [Plantactinospora mayteni]|uniref:Cytidylate kinase n=1 Tax=Plantactinospora mayteni TaxID=566021 RepID=A0ABQ4F3V6_9ACTN|nr:hypothetical protein Pma05_81520 [Plantactinospora mayteni]
MILVGLLASVGLDVGRGLTSGGRGRPAAGDGGGPSAADRARRRGPCAASPPPVSGAGRSGGRGMMDSDTRRRRHGRLPAKLGSAGRIAQGIGGGGTVAEKVRTGRCVVAVDGPSGSGKSTVSRRLASALGARYLDTGAMYRAVTWAVLRSGVDPQDAEGVAKVAGETDLKIGVDPEAPSVTADGIAVDREIRGPEVTAAVSAVSAVPAVRELLVAQQREMIDAAGRIVVEGRDIGFVVAPDADLKVYLTASAEARAQRRSVENAADLTATAADLARRDRLDSTRAADPLRRAPDAVVLDTTALGIDEVVVRLRDLLTERRPGR